MITTDPKQRLTSGHIRRIYAVDMKGNGVPYGFSEVVILDALIYMLYKTRKLVCVSPANEGKHALFSFINTSPTTNSLVDFSFINITPTTNELVDLFCHPGTHITERSLTSLPPISTFFDNINSAATRGEVDVSTVDKMELGVYELSNILRDEFQFRIRYIPPIRRDVGLYGSVSNSAQRLGNDVKWVLRAIAGETKESYFYDLFIQIENLLEAIIDVSEFNERSAVLIG